MQRYDLEYLLKYFVVSALNMEANKIRKLSARDLDMLTCDKIQRP